VDGRDLADRRTRAFALIAVLVAFISASQDI